MFQVFYTNKKSLRESVGKKLNFAETSVFGPEYRDNGELTVADGSPKRSWFARVAMSEGKIKKVV